MISVDSDQRPSISGGPLSGTYEFSQLHFHWGENDTMGSEDLIDGHRYVSLTLIHSKIYAKFTTCHCKSPNYNLFCMGVVNFPTFSAIYSKVSFILIQINTRIEPYTSGRFSI